MADAGAVGDSKLKVFISYSRRDEDFAQELLAGLQFASFDAYLDKRDIAAGEDWEARLSRLIETADTVVFVISPDAVASERCAWEVEKAVSLKKRMLPVVWRRVDETQVPPRLRQLNYIFFDRPLMSVPSLTALTTALTTDLGWIREHTRIGEAARRWNTKGRAEALLFRAEELTAAKAWLASPPKYAPEPTLLHHEFIKAGEDAEQARDSAERQRLEKLAAAIAGETEAQAEREKALARERSALDRMKLAQAAIAALLVGIVVVGITWQNQRLLFEWYTWRVSMVPSVLTDTKEKEYVAAPGASFRECAIGCPLMVVVPAGSFMMGSPNNEDGREDDEDPRRKVSIPRSFAVSKTEVTFDEWDACVHVGACPPTPDSGWGRGNRPVINVSWEDARQYAAWLTRLTGRTYRLLTEAEWEYSARAGSTGRWSFGDDVAMLNEHAWFEDNSDAMTQPVAGKKPNAFGLHDMHGNVAEWVQDCYAESYQGAPTDGSAVQGQSDCSRVLRGGTWEEEPSELRVARRYDSQFGFRDSDLGFRVARSFVNR